MAPIRTTSRPTLFRSRRLIILVGTSLLALVGSAAARLLPIGSTTGVVPAAQLDTVTVYGPRQFNSPTGSTATHVETFSVAAPAGRLFLLRFESGASDGSHRATGGVVKLNGATIIAAGEFAASAAIIRAVKIAVEDTLQVDVSGTAGTYVTVSVLGVPDPTFVVFGPRAFTRLTGKPFDDSVRFSLPAGAGAPQRLYITNGYPDGSHRSSSAVVSLNGVPLLGPSDLNQQVSALVRTVTLTGSNLLEVEMRSAPGSVLSFTLTATDMTPPVIVIQAPRAGEITRLSSILVTGTVRDQTATTVTVNGTPGAVTPGAPGTIAFSATVPLTSEGTNTIVVSATDAAGHRTDSTRTVIRDQRAPEITVTAPADHLITNADSVTVAGSIADLTSVSVNVNGVPLTLGTNGAFSAKVGLAAGANFLIVSATDTVGNSATITRVVTQDKAPPELAVTDPANNQVTNLASLPVRGTVRDATAVTVRVNGVNVPVLPDGSFDGTVPLNVGTNTVQVIATDAATNTTTVSRTVVRDTTPPDLALSAPVNALITNTATVTVAGTVADASAVSVTVNGVLLTIGAGGAFETVVTLASGSNLITAIATDAAGNASSATRAVTQDQSPPVLAVTEPADNKVTKLASWPVRGTVQDATAVILRVNGVDVPLAPDGSFDGTVPLNVGTNTVQVIATDAATNTTTFSRTVVRDTLPPDLALSAPVSALITSAATVTVVGTVADASAVSVTVNGMPLTIGDGGAFGTVVTLNPGTNLITATAVDAAGNASSATRAVTLDNTPPAIAITTPANGSTLMTSSVLVSGTVTDASAVTATLNGAALTLGSGGAFSTNVALVEGPNTLTVSATDAAGNMSTAARTVTRQTDRPDLPIDPAAVAPVLNRTVVTSMAAASAFIYAARDRQIQTGMAEGTIDPVRATVVRGRVLSADLSPLDAVVVSVLGHPEFGQTKSRLDGWFDMVVNGGGALTLAYAKTAYLPAQRQVDARWQDYSMAPDVVLLRPDTAVTVVSLGAATMQVARSSVVSDADGARQATVLLDAGTTASLRLPNGTLQPVTSLTLRATEFTVGENGPLAMPAVLPPTSQYTYAVNLTADEAVAAGATDVVLSTPAVLYVDNFLRIPVGSRVPVGSYDPAQGAWVAQDNGRIVKVLDVTGGVAQVDADGDGAADSDAALAALGMDLAERTRIATLFAPGTSFSRVETRQPLRIIDLNYAAYILGVNPAVEVLPGCAAKLRDVIRCDIQRSRQSVGVAGTPFSLNYTSANTEGGADRTLSIPLTGATLPAELGDVRLEVRVAGQVFRQTFAPSPNLIYTFSWDGKDAYGRAVQGTQPVTVRVGYSFPVRWQVAADASRSFGLACSAATTQACDLAPPAVSQPRGYAYRWQDINTSIGGFDAKALGLGGFMVDAQNVYDPARQLLYTGDGRVRVGQAMVSSIKPVIGTGSATFSGLNGPAAKAGFPNPVAMATGPDGSIYVASAVNNVAGLSRRVFRVRPDGVLVPFAGNGTSSTAHFGFQVVPGEDGPALDAVISQPVWLDVGPDGSVYIVDGGAWSSRLLRVTPDGKIHRIAGGPSRNTPMSVGANATTVTLSSPRTVAVGRDGAVYFTGAGSDNGLRVWRVGTDSTLSVVAGNGTVGYGVGDGGLATRAGLNNPGGMALGPDGSLYFTDETRVRRVTPDGILHTVAGNGLNTFSTQGLPATQSATPFLRSVAVAPDGTLYLATDQEVQIVTPNGIMNTLAGSRFAGVAGDGGPARAARFWSVTQIALTPANELLVVDVNHHAVRRIAAPMPGVSMAGYAIASEDGRELYGFDGTGRHLVTRDVSTGVTLYTYAYDAQGRLTTITDQDQRVTSFVRDASGRVTAVVAPNGQRSSLSSDADGNLASVVLPGGNGLVFDFTAGGLLRTMRDAAGRTIELTDYDSTGRVIRRVNALGGVATYSTGQTTNGSSLGLVTPDGQFTSAVYEHLPSGAINGTTILPGGASIRDTVNTDGSKVSRSSDGTVTTTTETADPRYGMQSPVIETVVRLPSGLTRTTRVRKGVTGANPDDPFADYVVTDSLILNGRTTTSSLDQIANRLTRTTAAGRSAVVDFDDQGRVTSMSVAGRTPLASTYDALGRVLSMNAGGRSLQIGYDSLDRVTSLRDALGLSERYVFDAADRVREHILPDGRRVGYSYDTTGNLTSVTPPGRPAHSMTYNAAGLLERYTAPDAGNGPSTSLFTYDSAQRVTRITNPDGSTLSTVYAPVGNDLTLKSSTGDTISFVTNATTQAVQQVLRPGGANLAYTYDGGLLTGITWSGGVGGSVRYTYDSDFRPTTELVNGASSVSMGYDPDGLTTQVGALALTRDTRTGDVTSTTLGGVRTSVAYSTFGEPDSTSATFNGSSLLSTRYLHDALGRIVSKTEQVAATATTFAFRYDSAGRLTTVLRDGVETESYEFDANGNRIRATTGAGTVVGSYDAQDRLRTYGSAVYTYTLNGELRRRISGTDTTRYSYDAFGQLRAVRLASGDSIEYVLDATGRRVGKRVNGTRVRGWLYSGPLSILAELDGAGAVVSRFVYVQRPNVPEYMVRGGQTYRLVTDELGSVRLVVNTATGAIAQQVDYDTFGRVTRNTNPGFQPFGFAGGLYDESTGLVRFGRRDYDAETGRWLTKDPLSFRSEDLKLYVYAGNDPVNYSDPFGLEGTLVEQEFVTTGQGKLQSSIGKQMVIKFKRDLECWAIEQATDAIIGSVYTFVIGESKIPYAGMTERANTALREREHSLARKATIQFKHILGVAKGTNIREAEQLLIDLMQVGADNPDEILDKVPLNSRTLNRVNSINKKLREKLRETYSWCPAK